MGKEEKKEKAGAENIKVLVRCRPLNSKEKEAGYKSAVDMGMTDGTVTVRHVCGDPDRWTFDAVINNTFSQGDVFNMWITPMIESVMDGFNATIFAYGQSGSGKTYTMSGVSDNAVLEGVIPRSFSFIFNYIKENSRPECHFNLYCSFLELYNGRAHDLLDKNMRELKIKENKDKTFFAQELLQPQVKFHEDLLRLMEEGTEKRRVASTELNADSSRSHSIFTVYVQREETTEDGDVRSVTSKLNLVDLAGSERQSKTGTSGDALKEGCNINLSLSALGTVIDTIVKGRSHIPYRSSPLTMLLKDSLGGGSKTCMFANINPSEHNVSETVSTLRFADRAKQIKNKPLVQMDAKDQKIADLAQKIEDMKEKLKRFEDGGFDELEKQNEQLQEQIGQFEVECESLREEMARNSNDTKEVLDSAKADMDAMRETITELQSDLEIFKKEKLVLEQQLQNEESQAAELRSIVTSFIATQLSETHTDALDIYTIQSKLQGIASQPLASGLEAVQRDERLRHESLLDDAHKEQKRERKRLEKLNTQAQEALEQSLTRMEKLKGKLENEKEKRKKLVADKDGELAELKASKEKESERLKKMIAELEANLMEGIGDVGTPTDTPADTSALQREVADLTAQLREAEISLEDARASVLLPNASDSEATVVLKRHLEDANKKINRTEARFAQEKTILEEEIKNTKLSLSQARQTQGLGSGGGEAVQPNNTKEVEELQAEVASLTAKLQKQAKERDAAIATSSTVQEGDSEAVAALKQQLNQLHYDTSKDAKESAADMGVLKQEVKSLRAALTLSQQEGQRQANLLKQPQSGGEAMRVELEECRSELHAAEAALAEAIESKKAAASALTAVSSDDSQAVASLKSELKLAQAASEGVEATSATALKKLKGDIKHLRKELAVAKEAQPAPSSSSEAKLKEELSQARRDVQDLEAKVEEIKVERDTVVTTFGAMSGLDVGDEAAALRAEIVSMQDSASKAEAAMTADRKQMKRELDSAKADLAGARAGKKQRGGPANNDLKAELAEYKRELQLMEEKLEAAENAQAAATESVCALSGTETEAISALKKELDSRTKASTKSEKGFKSEIKRLKQDLKTAKAALSPTAEPAGAQLQELSEARIEIASLEDKLTKAEEERAELVAKLSQPSPSDSDAVSSLKGELSALQKAAKKREKTLKADVSRLKLENKGLHADLSEEHPTLAHSAEELSRLNEEVTSLRSQLAAMKDAKDTVTNTLTSVNSNDSDVVAALKRELAVAHQALKCDVEALEGKNNELKSELSEARSGLRQQETPLSGTGSFRMNGSGADNMKLVAEVQKLERVIEMQKEDVATASRENDLYQQRLKEQTTSNEEQQTELDNLRKELEGEASKLAKERKQQVKLVTELEEVQTQIHACKQVEDKLREEIMHEKKAFDVHKASLESQYRDVGVIQEQLKEKNATLLECKGMVSSLQDIISNLRAKDVATIEKLAEAKKAIDQRDEHWQQQLTEQESNTAAMISRKVQELRVEHKSDLKKKNQENERLNKKIKKGELAVQKVKERYDNKVVQYEQLTATFEQYKLKQMERETDDQETAQESIQRIMKSAKVAKALRDDTDKRKIGESDTTDVEKRMMKKSAAAKKFSLDDSSLTMKMEVDAKKKERKSRESILSIEDAGENPLPRDAYGERREHRLKPVEGGDDKRKRTMPQTDRPEPIRPVASPLANAGRPSPRSELTARGDLVQSTSPSPMGGMGPPPNFAATPLRSIGNPSQVHPPGQEAPAPAPAPAPGPFQVLPRQSSMGSPRPFAMGAPRPAMGLEPSPLASKGMSPPSSASPTKESMRGLYPTPPR